MWKQEAFFAGSRRSSAATSLDFGGAGGRSGHDPSTKPGGGSPTEFLLLAACSTPGTWGCILQLLVAPPTQLRTPACQDAAGASGCPRQGTFERSRRGDTRRKETKALSMSLRLFSSCVASQKLPALGSESQSILHDTRSLSDLISSVQKKAARHMWADWTAMMSVGCA